MILKDFISNTLNQIIDGVVDAQNYAIEKEASINPEGILIVHNSNNKPMFSDYEQKNYAQIVEFDIALTVSDNSKDKGGAGINIGAFSIGGQIQSEQNNSSLNRIKFSIPIFLPQQLNK